MEDIIYILSVDDCKQPRSVMRCLEFPLDSSLFDGWRRFEDCKIVDLTVANSTCRGGDMLVIWRRSSVSENTVFVFAVYVGHAHLEKVSVLLAHLFLVALYSSLAWNTVT